MRAYPHFDTRVNHDLNGIWDFAFRENVGLDDVDIAAIQYSDRIPVPSAFDALPDYAGKRGLGIYRCFVDVTPGVGALLRIGGAGMSCHVYVDGALQAEHIGTYTPFEVGVPASSQSRREIVVVTDNRYDFERCPLHENFFDFYGYGGIIRQVWLEELPPNPIRRAHVLIEDCVSGKVRVRLEFVGTPTDMTCRVDCGEAEPVEAANINETTAEFCVQVPEPTLWSVEEPNLHLLTVATEDDAITVRFGLREVTTGDGHVLLNGKPLKLLGYCRHEAHPQFGPATPDMQLVADLQILRDLGCNFVRGSHYQQDPRFLDLCDELGFVVFSESLGWGQSEKELTNRAFIDAQLKQTETMIATDFNHPSIIMWGFLNEGASNEEYARTCYTELINRIRKLDPSRPVTYASNRGLNDLMLEQVDIVSFNFYPGWYAHDRDDEYPLGEVIPTIHELLRGLEERGLGDKPFIISEIGAGAIYGWRDAMAGHWTEQYQAEMLRTVCEEVVSNDRIAGLALWQFCDCRTYQGGRALMRPRGFNNKGTLDEYRRPKLTYETVKDIFAGFAE